MKKYIIVAISALFLAACNTNNNNSENSDPPVQHQKEAQATAMQHQTIAVEVGDLIFIDTDCGPLCNAINAVTPSYKDLPMSHVGFKVVHEGKPLIVHASTNGVVMEPLSNFLKMAKGEVVIGRVKDAYKQLLDSAMSFAKQQVGLKYNHTFTSNNNAYYCSELIYEAFKAANNGKPFFTLQPMTFINPQTKTTDTNWVQYFTDLKVPVPEGVLGCNPGEMSLSDKIDVVGTITIGGPKPQ